MVSFSSPIPWKKIKALSFDIFGTLVDWESGIYDSAHATILSPYLPKDRKEFLIAIERHDSSVQRERPTIMQCEVIAEGLQRYVKELGVVGKGRLSQDQVDQAATEYGGKIGEYKAFPDTIAAMQRLEKYYKLIPLSNVDNASFSQTLSGPLKGIEFSAIYTAEDIGSYKPDVRNFHYLLEHVKQEFGTSKDELCHVAQSLLHDHGPATLLKIQSVWVDRHGVMGGEVGGDSQEKYGYKLRVETLGALADLVEEAMGTA